MGITAGLVASEQGSAFVVVVVVCYYARNVRGLRQQLRIIHNGRVLFEFLGSKCVEEKHRVS